MKYVFFFIYAFFFFYGDGFGGTNVLAQKSNPEIKQGQTLIDSLQTKLLNAKDDSNKVYLLDKLSFVNRQLANFDSAIYYGEQAKLLAEKIKFKKGIAWSYNHIGIALERRGKYVEAMESFFAALNIYKETGDKNGVSDAYSNIGTINENRGNYVEALKNFLASLKIEEELGNKSDIAVKYSKVGNVYWQQNNFKEALRYYFAALKLNEELGEQREIASNYNSIGNVYVNLRQYPEALNYFFSSLKINKELGAMRETGGNYANIGGAYRLQGNADEALEYLFMSLRIGEEKGLKRLLITVYNNIGEVYIAVRRAEEGKKWLQKALALGKETGVKNFTRNSYQGLSAADSSLGNFKGAFENYKMYIVYRDSLYNEENTKKLTQTSMQYEFDKKEAAAKAEQEKKDIRQANIRNSAFAGLAGLLIFSMAVMRQRNKVKKEKARSEALLLNILPEEVAEELKEKGAAEAKQFDEVTVLFTDFKGFTAMSEKLSPKDLVKDLNECFSAFDQIVENHGLEKIKTIGDAYMCVGGLPMPNSTHASDAVKAAMEMRDFIEEGKSRKIKNGLPYFEIRIGIHTGSVVAGIVGLKKFAYDIWGDTVNTASRMESSGEAGKVNISETTYQLVKDDFTCTHRGKIQAKGKGEIDMYFVEG